MIKLLIADNSILIREGLKALLNDVTNFAFVGSVGNNKQLKEMNSILKPDVLIIDCYSLLTSNSELKALKKCNKNLQILAITQMISKQEISAYLNGEVTSYLLKECDKEEIIDAIHETRQGNRFLCGKIAHVLSAPEEIAPTPAYMKSVSCEGISVTEREADVIRYIAEGLSNKQIADKLFLSTHTVNTHRKNIMNKLGVNNTAGIVMYAVKNNLLERNTLLFAN
jgi:DNA-binding NarL/FixJ family response regulator